MFRAETVSVFSLIAPGYVALSLAYFVVVECFARSECLIDEFLLVGRCVMRLISSAIRQSSPGIGANASAWKQANAGNLLRTVWIKTHFGMLMIFYGVISSTFFEKSVRQAIQLAQANADAAAIYPAIQNSLIQLLLTADTAVALIGYVSSCRLFNNQTYDTESSFSGVCFTLVCYHPFNLVMQMAIFGALSYCWPSEWLRTAPFASYPAMVSVLLLFCVYVSSTICFGTRFSNLSNRGLVDCGIYRIIRHPSYASKNLAWWICVIPMIYAGFASADWKHGLFVLGSMCAVTFAYVMRGLTEERFLEKDHAYREYCKKVRYRFIPGIV
jgi:protein-S-isoprenylcysteine O-methyltransferase Ste14